MATKVSKYIGIGIASILGLILLLFIALWLLIQPLSSWLIKRELAAHPEMHLEYDTFKLKPAKGSLTLTQVKASMDNIGQTLTADSIHLDNIRWIHMMLSKELIFNQIYTGKITFETIDDFYSIDSLRITTKDAHFHGIYTRPQHNKLDYAKHLGYQKGWMEARVRHVALSQLRLPALLKQNGFYADSLTVEQASLYYYRDKNVPPAVLEPLPSSMIRAIPIPIRIKQVSINNARMLYEEVLAGHTRSGKMSIQRVFVTIPDFSNANNAKWVAQISASIDGKLPLKGQMGFDLADKKDRFSLAMESKEGLLTAFNDYSSPNLFVGVRSGKLNSMKMIAAGNTEKMKGFLQMDYEKLKIDFLKKKDGMPSEKRFTVLSLVANSVVPDQLHAKPLPADLQPSDINLDGKTRLKGYKETEIVRDPYTSISTYLIDFVIKAITDNLWSK